VALLIPDHHIGSFYNSYLAPLHNHQITVVLAHGYAVFNGSLIPQSPTHAIALLAPKAIGPELRRHFCQHRAKAGPGATHSLKAAYHYPTHIGNTRQQHFEALTRSLGFASDNLIPCPPETEALADLISEQGLLCGGLFTLLAWTMQTMKDSAIPQALIQEECITELKLIANLLQERGPVGTLDAISQAAAAGAALMSQELNQPAIKNVFMDQLAKIKSGEFVREYESGHWKEPLASLKQSLNQESSPNP
jgi:ketol-acid reductoisomerase